jgi:hypothetical protein
MKSAINHHRCFTHADIHPVLVQPVIWLYQKAIIKIWNSSREVARKSAFDNFLVTVATWSG